MKENGESTIVIAEKELTATNPPKRYGLIIFVVVLALIGLMAACSANNRSVIQKLPESLSGKTFSNVMYDYDLMLYDTEKNISYEFYGAKSTFRFIEDGTLVWVRQYDRSILGHTWTREITTTESYEVLYKGGNLFFDSSAVYLKLESGDVLQVQLDKDKQPTKVNYSRAYDQNLNAPEELRNMETDRVSGSTKTGSSKKRACPGGSVSCRSGFHPCHEMSNGYCNQCCKD